MTPPETVRAPRRDAARNHDALVQSAARALRRDPDAPLGAIAAEAGLTRRAVYGHFAGRDELVAEVFAAGAARISAAVETVAHPDAAVELAQLGLALWAEVDHIRLHARLAVRGPHRHRVGEAMEPVRRRLRALAERGAAEGALRSDLPPAAVARLVEGTVLAVLDEVAAEPPDATDADPRDLVVLAALGAAGLSWTDARAILDREREEAA